MATEATNNTIARQWAMLMMLPSRGSGIAASELVDRLSGQGFAVSVRTVQRDLISLSDIFPIRSNEKSKPIGWLWDHEAKLEIPGLSVQDALTVAMIQDYLKPLLPASLLGMLEQRFDHAQRVLEGLESSNHLARWRDKVRAVSPTLPVLPPKVDPDVLDVIQQAVLTEVQLQGNYWRSGDAEDEIEVLLHPLAVVQRGPITYLVATTFNYPHIRLYALHRFDYVELTDTPINRPADFDIDTYINAGGLHFGNGESISLKIRVNSHLNDILAESPLSEDMECTAVGDEFLVTASVQSTWQLRWWLLSHADMLSVLGPPELKQGFLETLREAVRRNPWATETSKGS